MRAAFYGSNTTTVISEDEKKEIEDIPRNYPYNW